MLFAWVPSFGWELPSSNSWPAVLFSGVFGAFFTLAAQGIIAWWRRPVLRLLFGETEKGCRVVTPPWQTQDQATGRAVDIAEQVYLRLKVENQGRTFAKNVNVCITEIVFANDARFEDEVLDLGAALMPDSKGIFNLASKGHRFVDLVHCDSDNSLQFDIRTKPRRLSHLEQSLEPGEFEALVFVSAENAASVRASCKWRWDGTIEGLRITPGRRWWPWPSATRGAATSPPNPASSAR
jgi:hypothetical protein